MLEKEQVLDHSAARAYYDRFGKKQDSQGFYEDPALEEIAAYASFQDARNIFEFGCGTGRFAARILKDHLPSSANYLGCDISPVMVGLAKERLEAYGERAKVVLLDGAVRFPLTDHSVDRVVSSYVLDLLSEGDIHCFFSESHRVVGYRGKVCLASLTRGVTLPSRIVSSLWMTVFRKRPSVVGGCRPISCESYVDFRQWKLEHQRVLTPFGVPSEVLVLISRDTPNKVNTADARSSRDLLAALQADVCFSAPSRHSRQTDRTAGFGGIQGVAIPEPSDRSRDRVPAESTKLGVRFLSHQQPASLRRQ